MYLCLFLCYKQLNMKPKILQVRGIAYGKTYKSISDEFRSDFLKDLIILDELDFTSAYKSNKRGCHYDVYLGKSGTLIFRPFHFLDGLDDFCYFDVKQYSIDKKHSLEFYQWSSKQEAKLELWFDDMQLLKGTQKKTIRSTGDKSLIKNNSIYDTVNFYLQSIVGKSVEDLSSKDKIYRCVSSFNRDKYSNENKFLL